MRDLIKRFSELTLDQKRYLFLGLACLLFLFLYAISRVNVHEEPIIQQVKTSDFKNGNMTVDETSGFYKAKEDLVRKQYDQMIENQKNLEGKLEEIQKKMDDTKPLQAATTPNPTAQSGPSLQAEAEKKLKRRGQNQSKISFLSVTQMEMV